MVIVGPALSSGALLLALLPTLNVSCYSPFLPYTNSFSICGCAVINLDSSLCPAPSHLTSRETTSQSFSIFLEGDPANDRRCALSQWYNQVHMSATQLLSSNSFQSCQTKLGGRGGGGSVISTSYLWPIGNRRFQGLDYHSTFPKSVL